MDKRTFLKLSGMAGAGIVVAPTILHSCKAPANKVPPASWVWYSAGKKDEKGVLKDLLNMNEAGFEGVHLQASTDLLHEILPEMKKTKLRIHAWIITMMVSDPEVERDHPDWYTVSRDGKSSLEHPPYVPYYHWLCPTKPAVVEYTTGRVDELCRMEELEGIHLDYIRYPDVILPVGLWEKYDLIQDKEYPSFDFCYCDDCRNAFKKQTGKDPLELEDPPADDRWRQFRYDSITHVVNHLYDYVHQRNKKLSAAVFPTPNIAKRLVRQDWVNWNLDQIHPMIYHNFYEKPPEWIGKATEEGTSALQGKFPLYSGVFVPQLTPEELAKVHSMVVSNGASGVTLFNWKAMTPQHWKAFYV